MGGEWWFNFKLEKKAMFDLKAYQAMLPKLKAEYKENKHEQVFWCPDDPLPPADNIYARFTYKCERAHTSWGPDHPVWHLFWDPTIVTEELSRSNVHGRCGFMCYEGRELQAKLAREFPEHFDYERENEYQYDYDDSEEGGDGFFGMNYTDCHSDCGFCRDCWQYGLFG